MAALDDILGAPAEPKGQSQATVALQNPSASFEDKPATAADALATVNSQVPRPKPLSYVEMFQMMNPDRPETPEEKAKREKREKGEAALAAVGDGISALSNLWFTSQYAPNAYDASKGLSAATQQRWDKLRKEREANRRAYYEGYIRARSMDEANARDERNWKHSLEREKIADERYNVQQEMARKQAELDEQLKRHQITAAEYQAEMNRIAAQYAEGTEQLKQENLRAGIGQKRAAAGASHASANASNAKADYYKNGGGTSGGNSRSLRINGETHTYSSKDDYDRAVEAYAKLYGVNLYVTYKDGYDRINRQDKYTTKRKPTAQIAAEVEAKANENETMPGVDENAGSSTTMPGVK